jgi:hypothetical protein
MKRFPLKLFFCYAHEDLAVRRALDSHIEILRREGIVATWYDGRISPGSDWSKAIEEQLRQSDLILFLISSAFLKSEYIANVEMVIALELNESRAARVVPVLVEKIRDFKKLPIGSLQALPTPLKPIRDWQDQVKALDDVVAGLRRAAMGVIIEAGGAFEFGPHLFSEAELAELEPRDRDRTLDGLGRLRSCLLETLPRRRLEKNLLVASWDLQESGPDVRTLESHWYIAQLLSSFDVIALQGLSQRLGIMDGLTQKLGPEWHYLATDLSPGMVGNNERFAILYYQPRVAFEHVSGELLLPPGINAADARTLVRNPFVVSLRAGAFKFRSCVVELPSERARNSAPNAPGNESETLAEFLATNSDRFIEHYLLMSNAEFASTDSPMIREFKRCQFLVQMHPVGVGKSAGFGLIGFRMAQKEHAFRARICRSGYLSLYDYIYRKDEFQLYKEVVAQSRRQFESQGGKVSADDERWYWSWRRRQLSSRNPLWLELEIEPTATIAS